MNVMDVSSHSTEQSDEVLVQRDPRGDDVGLEEVWRIIWLRRMWLVASTAVLVAAIVAYCVLTPPLYSATAQILIDPRDRQVLTNDINPATTAPDGGVTQVESQSKVLESSGVLLRAIAVLDLTHDAEFGAVDGALDKIVGALRRSVGLTAPALSEADMSAITLRNLRRRLAIKRADKVFVVDVTLTSKDREKSALIVNAIVDAYLADQADSKSDAALQASDSLTSRLEEQRDKVRDAANAVAAYKAANNIVEANNLLVNDQTLSELSAELGAAQSKTALLRTRLARVQASGAVADDDATAEAMKSSTISQLRNQEATLVQTASQLRLELGPRHPAIRKVEGQLADLRRLIDEELARLKQSSRNDFERAVAYENELTARLKRLKDEKVGADQTFVGLNELERELDARRTVYSSYLLRSEETREQARVDSTNVRVISRAVPPQDKSWPPSGLLIVAALGGGLGLGAAAALLAEYVTPTIHSRSQMQRVCGAWDVGIVPMPDERRRPAPRKASGWLARWASRWTLMPPALRRNRRESPAQRRMEIAVALALSRLQGAGPNGGGGGGGDGRSILVTSGRQENDDRRTIVQYMAAAAAVQGLSVLFVDADPESRSETPQPGLLDVLCGDRSLSAAVQADTRTGITLLGFGREAGTAGRAGAGPAARLMLAEARRRFDFVIIDGGVVAEDMRAWSLVAAADEVIFAAKLGRTRKLDVTAAMEALSAIGRRISGTLLLIPAERA